jgi:hypothetical protein
VVLVKQKLDHYIGLKINANCFAQNCRKSLKNSDHHNIDPYMWRWTSTWRAFPAAAAAAAAAATAAGLASVGCCIPAMDDVVDRSVARPGCCMADTVGVGETRDELEVAEFMAAAWAAAAAAAAWAAATGVLALGRGLAEAAGISITGVDWMNQFRPEFTDKV